MRTNSLSSREAMIVFFSPRIRITATPGNALSATYSNAAEYPSNASGDLSPCFSIKTRYSAPRFVPLEPSIPREGSGSGRTGTLDAPSQGKAVQIRKASIRTVAAPMKDAGTRSPLGKGTDAVDFLLDSMAKRCDGEKLRFN